MRKKFEMVQKNSKWLSILIHVQQQYVKIIVENFSRHLPAGIYLLKVNNRNTRTRCEICSKLTIKTPECSLTLNM